MFKQVELSYSFNALEPHIDEVTMQTHYGKHHATYTANLNAAVEKAPELSGKSIEELLSDLNAVPEAIRTAVRNNGGGYYNHNVYFSVISPKGGGEAKGALAKRIDLDFGSFEAMKEKLTAASVGQFGAGWGWLVTDKNGALSVISTANQDTPLEKGLIPLVPIDVWEHAYYLKYKNLRADYVKNFFNVIDWDVVGSLYDKAVGA